MLKSVIAWCESHIQQKLLAEMDFSYDRAYFLALRVEASEKDSMSLVQQEVNPPAAEEHELYYNYSQFNSTSEVLDEPLQQPG